MTGNILPPFVTNHHSDGNHDRDGTITGGTVAAFDVRKMFTAMFELGTGMLRMQQQMFAEMLGTTIRDGGDVNKRDAGDRRTSEQESALGDVTQVDIDPPAHVLAIAEAAVAQRAEEISRSPEAGSDFDNWIRAERELGIRSRAEEISRSPQAGSDLDNWIRAEREG